MNNAQTKRRDDDIDEEDEFEPVTVNEDDIPENKDIDRDIDETERQQWDEDDSTLPGEQAGETNTGMKAVDYPNRPLGMQQGAADEGSIVSDEDLEDEDLDDEDDEDDLVDVPM